MQGTNWIFTINNPGEGDDWSQLGFADTVAYACWQLECGAEGTRHLQGWIVFKTRVRLSTVKSASQHLQRAHLEVQRGTNRQAKDYVTKDDTRVAGPWEYLAANASPPSLDAPSGRRGVTQDSGSKRSAWGEILPRLEAGESPEDLLLAGAINSSGIMRLATDAWVAMESRKRDLRCDRARVVVITGPTGCGKSHWIYTNRDGIDGGSAYSLPLTKDTKWWDGYQGEKICLLDDFYGEKNIEWSTLLRYLDKYPVRVEKKGSSAQLKVSTWFITSNARPDQWYTVHDCSPLYRRITSWFKWVPTQGGGMQDGEFLEGHCDLNTGEWLPGARV